VFLIKLLNNAEQLSTLI